MISGSFGSCLMRFSTVPFLFCDIENNCDYSSSNDYSYWLSTAQPITPSTIVQGNKIQLHISRCALCEAPANVMSFHSFSLTPPPCPNGWNILWQGYSFAMVCRL